MSSPSLSISLDVSELFYYAQIVITALIPVVLITGGFGLGFFILKILGNALRNLG